MKVFEARLKNTILFPYYCALNKYLIFAKNLQDEANIFTHLTNVEKYMLYHLASKKHGNFVEIGSYLGASTTFIALACSENRKGAQLFCVDTWQNDAMSEGTKDTYAAFLNNTKRFERLITPVRSRSEEFADIFDEGVDFLFIDGDHSYEGVRADVQAWFPQLNHDALVILHDYGWAEGVRKVIREFVAPRAKKEGSLPNLYWAWM